MVGQVRRWSRERLQFVLWYSKKIDPTLYKKAGYVSCPVCHMYGYPVLQRPCDFVGEVLWACVECGTTIGPAEKTARAKKNSQQHGKGSGSCHQHTQQHYTHVRHLPQDTERGGGFGI